MTVAVTNDDNDICKQWKSVIEELQKHNEWMEECLQRIYMIVKMYPPRKDENKFHYGKLIEKILIHYINQVVPCRELDLQTSCGSHYKNDMELLSNKMCCSIKVSKSGSAVTLINKRTRSQHCLLETCFMVCNLKKNSLYFIVHNPSMQPYIKENGATITYRSTIFRYMEQNQPHMIFRFPMTQRFENFKKRILTTIPEYDFYSREMQRILECSL